MMAPGGPGWNDPPSLSYETHTKTTSRRNLLTKRVGLPSLTVPNESPVPPYTSKDALPPSGKKNLPPPTKLSAENTAKIEIAATSSGQSMVTENKGNTDERSLKDKAGSQVPTVEGVKIFNPSGNDNRDNTDMRAENTEDNSKQCDLESVHVDIIADLKKLVQCCHDDEIITVQVKNTINKKIAILEKQMNENKLSDPVLKKVETLTKFLVLKMYDNAWNTHLSLVCDHSSSVMQWIVGVKKLISEAKKLK